MTEATKIWQVSEVTRLVKDVLEQSFYPFWVIGEVSNLTIHRSGHVYFTLKDERSQVRVVYFRGAPAAQEAGLQEGLSVEAFGRLSVYEPRGEYQLIIERLRLKGQGELQRRFEELKERLRAEGLFDEERKRPIPALPRTIGVVTSPQGAALRDFLQILDRRFAGVHVRVYPAAVQGRRAASEIAAGIEFFSSSGAADVIVITRGGGSLEDLWPFNEEIVARAVAASALPIISAVGHEVDFTICDFAADLRVPTPSAAAELVIGRKAELVERIGNLAGRLRSALALQVSDLRRRVQLAAESYVFREPGNLVRTYQQRVDEAVTQIENAWKARAERLRTRLAHLEGQLAALNPKRVLDRGYAILVVAETGSVVKRAAEVDAGEHLEAILAAGGLELTVDRVKPAAEQGEQQP